MNLKDYLITPDWPAPSNVHALITTRLGGVSTGPYATMNLADHVGDDPAAVARNREILRVHIPNDPKWLKQVHGNVVVTADELTMPPEADASIARKANTVSAVLTADCLPVLFCNMAGTVVAAAHAGWRGLAGGVLETTVKAMDEAPENIMAYFGPAIGPGAFEVGDEVRDAFMATDQDAALAFTPGNNGKWFADIYLLARQRLDRLGIIQVFGGEFCTYLDAKRFYSYRRDGHTGRMASLIWMD